MSSCEKRSGLVSCRKYWRAAYRAVNILERWRHDWRQAEERDGERRRGGEEERRRGGKRGGGALVTRLVGLGQMELWAASPQCDGQDAASLQQCGTRTRRARKQEARWTEVKNEERG
jgi:hypothetical protein